MKEFLNKTKTQLCIASMAQWQSVSFQSGVVRVPAQANTIYLRLGFLHHKLKMLACNWYLITNLAGHLELVGHLKKKKTTQNLNAPQICYQVPGIIIIKACRYKVSYVCERGIKHSILVSQFSLSTSPPPQKKKNPPKSLPSYLWKDRFLLKSGR